MKFALLCALWLLDMAALAAIGPLGHRLPAAMLLYGLGFVLLIGLVRWFPEKLSASRAWTLVFALGLSARLLFLFYPPGNDIYRYIWEGHIQNHGFNPYLLPPDSPALDHLARGGLSAIRERVNHPWVTAIYPPASLLLFRVMAWVSPTALFFKTILLLFDIGVMAVLMKMLKVRGLPAARLLFYAANPLVIVFIAGEGHLDVIQAFFLLLACLLLIDQHRGIAGSLCLGLAVMSKYISVVALPFLGRRKDRRKNLAVLAPLLLYLPFLGAGEGIFSSLGLFSASMHYNDSMAHLLRSVLGQLSLPVLPGLLSLCIAWVYLTVDDPLRGTYLSIAGLLLFLPTLHPWYLVLVAPFLCFFPSTAWICLQAAMLFTFPVLAVELAGGGFHEVGWLKALVYIPFYGLLIAGLFRNRSLATQCRYDAPHSVSVIIPAVNEAAHVAACIDSVGNGVVIREVILADGGSTDDTAAVACSRGVRVVQCERGRGRQIRAAAEIATGEVLLILHADAVLKKDAAGRIIRALTEDRHAPGGSFGMAFAEAGLKRRIIAALNNLRARTTGIAFGDQAQFVRAAALSDIGGFPGLMLMEDVELSLRLKRLGRPLFLNAGVVVSGRRWQDDAFLQNLRLVLGLFFRYLIERRLGRTLDGERYYRKYYGMDPTVLTAEKK